MFKKSWVYFPDRPVQPIPIFVGKASSLPLSGAPERCSTWVGSILICILLFAAILLRTKCNYCSCVEVVWLLLNLSFLMLAA